MKAKLPRSTVCLSLLRPALAAAAIGVGLVSLVRAQDQTVTGDLIVTGNATISGATASTSTTTGALIVPGGVGIGGDAYIGGAINVAALLASGGTISGSFSVDSLTITGGTLAGGTTGLSLAAGGTNQNITLTPSGTGITTTAKQFSITAGTASSSASTGAFVVSGGIGVGGDVNIGGAVFAGGAVSAASFSATNGALSGGAAGLTIDAGGSDQNITLAPSGAGITTTAMPMTVTNTTSSTSTTTGALVVSGGIGIAGSANIGGTLNVANLQVGGQSFTPAGYLANSGGTVSGSLAVDSLTLSTGGLGGGVSGLALSAGGANQNITLTPSGTGITTTAKAFAVTASTQSNATTTGALVVTGGAGLGGNLNVGGAITTAGAVNAASVTTSGAITVGGTLTTSSLTIGGQPFTAANFLSTAGGTLSGTLSGASGLSLNAGGANGTNQNITLTPTGSGVVAIAGGAVVNGDFTVPGAGSGSLKLGTGATAGGALAIAIGSSASAGSQGALAIGFLSSGGPDSTAVGYAANAAGTQSIALGTGANTGSSGSLNVALGVGAQVTSSSTTGALVMGAQATGASQSVVIGANSHALDSGSIVIGSESQVSAGHSDSIVIGRGAVTTTSSQFLVGSAGRPIRRVNIGGGVTSSAPSDLTWSFTSATGTDVVGKDVTFEAERSTGNATSGRFVFATAMPGSSGSTMNGLSNRLIIDQSPQQGLIASLPGGYSGSGVTFGLDVTNSAASTGAAALGGPSGLAANVGARLRAVLASNGDNVGGYAYATGGARNIGLIGDATLNQWDNSGAGSIGVYGSARRSNENAVEIGGYFGLNTAAPALTSAALVADNGTSTSPIFIARDNGSTIFRILDGGTVSIDATTASSSSTSGALLVAGGAGIAGSLNLGGAVSAAGAATASSLNATTGNVNGGTTGLALNAGGTNQNVTFTPSGTGVTTTAKPLRVTDTTQTTSQSTGALVVSGGAAVAGDVTVGGNVVGGTNGLTLGTASNQNITIAPGGTGITTTPKALAVTAATASTSASTGALVVAGGVGVTGDLNIGGTLKAGALDVGGAVFDPSTFVSSTGATFTGAVNVPTLTASNGTISGGSTGLTMQAGGSAQNIRLLPSSTGYVYAGGNVGIGTAVQPSYRLDVGKQSSLATNNDYAANVFLQAAPDGDSLYQIAAFNAQTYTTGTHSLGEVNGVISSLTIGSDGTNTKGAAVLAHVATSFSDGFENGAADSLYGIRTSLDHNASNTLDKMVGLYVPQIDVARGAIRHVRGVEIGNLAEGTGAGAKSDVYAIYSGGASDRNRFAGPTRFGDFVSNANTDITSPVEIVSTNTAASGIVTPLYIAPIYNQNNSTAANSDLYIRRTETVLGTGGQFLIDAGTATAGALFTVSNTGAIGTAAGNVTGGSTGLTLNAGGANQNIVLAPGGLGITTTASPVSVTNSVNSASAATGALVVAGGVGVGRDITVGGGNVTGGVTGLNLVAGGSNQNIALAPSGTGITTTAKPLSVTDTTASSSAATGALMVVGGAGIGGDTNIGGALVAVGAATVAELTSITGNITGGVDGVMLLAGGTNQNITLAPSGTGVTTTGKAFVVAAATSSTSTATGAFVVGGGAGIAGSVNIGGSVSTAGLTTTGSLAVENDAGVSGNVIATGDVTGATIVATAGTLTGGTSGLTLNAGGTNKSITLTPSGSGYTLLNGKVGLGVVAPVEKLDVDGNIHLPKSSYVSFGTTWGESGNLFLVKNGDTTAFGASAVDGGSGYANTNAGFFSELSLQAPAGTAQNPAFGFTSEDGLGAYRPAAATLGFTTSGTERARFDSTGALLIGTATNAGSERLQALIDSSTTDNWVNVAALRATSTGTAAVGLGPRMRFYAENSTGSETAIAGLGARLTSANGADSEMVLEPRTSGSSVEALRASGTGVRIPLTTASTSSNTGALVVSGGMGVAGDFNVGGTSAASFYVASSGIFGDVNGLTLSAGASDQNVLLSTAGTGVVRAVTPQFQLDAGSGALAAFSAKTLGGAGSSVRFTLEGLSSNDDQSIVWRRGATSGTIQDRWRLGVSGSENSPDTGTGSSLKFERQVNDGGWQTVLFLDRSSGSVGIATSSPNSTYKLDVNGKVRATEFVVNSGGADYVFDENYRLAPLTEVEAQIAEHKHLPGIPSAKEMSEKGVGVGELQVALLAKVEELTLHMIAQQKQLTEQAARIQVLENENARLVSNRP